MLHKLWQHAVKVRILPVAAALFLCGLQPQSPARASGLTASAEPAATVETEARRLMQDHDLPGLAIAVTVGGEHRIFNYGVASRESGAAVDDDTLFEIGSISKTFTGLLAAYAHVQGKLSLFDEVSSRVPALEGSAFDAVRILELATHTSGLELFLPPGVDSQDALVAYCRGWERRYSPGTERTYSNIGIALLGSIAADALQRDYDDALANLLLPKLGLANTYTQVPPHRIRDYAQGYTTENEPARLSDNALASAPYGVKTTATDLIRYVEAHMQSGDLEPDMQSAIGQALTGYYKADAITQDLVWEQYAYPVSLKRLLDGNSRRMARDDVPAMHLKPPFPPRRKVLVNKTGSTRGFSAYVAFVPGRRIGVAILANRNVSVRDRVRAGYRILAALKQAQP
ncbi:class C beta-lactamase [Nitratireductor sp. OM-1]|uniref:class C beta-lactamase n=1 Tax=Nitratireductor sp. OM-1 TaxID=1756988 RepID=UPI000DDE434F|nr:class C beta-lactamase [Nitratireductor sp. OM-1]